MTLQRTKLVGLFILAVVAGLAWTPPARATEAQVQAALDLVPPEAHIVAIVPDIGALNKKISAFMQTLGVNDPNMNDVLGKIKTEAGLTEGLNEDGTFLFVLTDIAKTDGFAEQPVEEADQPMFMLVPVKDYKAVVGAFKGNADDEVTELVMPDGNKGYARKVEGYALMSPNKNLVTAYKAPKGAAKLTKAMGKLGAKSLGGADALLLLNVEAMAPALGPKFDKGVKEITAGMEGMAAAMPAQAKMVKTIVQLYADGAQAMLRDTSFVVLAGSLDDKGIGMTAAMQFKTDSYMAKLFKASGGAAEQLVKVPDGPYLFAMASSLKGVDMKTLLTDLAGKLSTDADDTVSQMIKGTLPALEKVQGMSQVLYAPQNKQPGTGLINVVSIIQTSDPAGYVKTNKANIERMNNLKLGGADKANGDGGGDPPIPAITYTAKYTENALQIEGIQVDQYEWQVNVPKEMLQNPQMGQMMQMLMMLGVTGQTGYVAATADHVVMTSTPDAKLLRQGLANAKDGKGLGNDKLIAQVRKEGLLPESAVEAYVNPAGLVSLANLFIGLMGKPAIEAPNNLAPVGVAVKVDDGAVAGRLYVPVAVIKFFKDAVEQTMGAGRRGPRGPGGGDGPPPPPF